MKKRASAPQTHQAAIPIHEGVQWNGFYICRQGPTNLTLKINSVSNVQGSHFYDVKTIFDFNFGNGQCTGAIEYNGQFDSKTRSLVLKPGSFLHNSCNYIVLDKIQGYVTPDGREYSGHIISAGCTTFKVSL